MKPEVIIKNWLMSWLRPEKLTELNTSERDPITENNFGNFIGMFLDERNEPIFSEDEIEVLKRIITKPLHFGTGYPLNEKEAIELGTIYIIHGGWQQTGSYPGANFWEGRASTHIAVVGLTAGDTLNMAEPSLLLQVVTSLLIAGRNVFTFHHLLNPVITETLYGQDESNSLDKGFSIRSLSLAYDGKRHGVITKHGTIQ